MALKVEAMIFCDQVIQDSASNKSTLVGVFDIIWALNFPAQHQRMSLLARITGAAGQKVSASLRIMKPSDHLADLPVQQVELNLYGRANIIFNIEGQPFPEEGEYRYVLLLNDKESGETKILAQKTKQPPSTEVH